MGATLTFSKKAQYRLPAGSMAAIYMDGVYINGNLFDDNIPVRDGVVRIGVWPKVAHWVDHWANFGIPTFKNGKVVRLGHKFWWPPGSKEGKSYDLYYDGHPYGMGLNTIAAQLSLSPLPITQDIVYDVIYVFIVEVG
jgi:hypothetical protein